MKCFHISVKTKYYVEMVQPFWIDVVDINLSTSIKLFKLALRVKSTVFVHLCPPPPPPSFSLLRLKHMLQGTGASW